MKKDNSKKFWEDEEKEVLKFFKRFDVIYNILKYFMLIVW